MRVRSIGITALVVVIVTAALIVGIGASNADGGSDGDDRGDDLVGGAVDSPFIGLTSDQASALAESEGRRWRISREDGTSFALNADIEVGRVTFELDDGLVTAAHIEEPFDDSADPSAPVTQADQDAAAILAAAVAQLLTFDHGFSESPPPFTEVYIADAFGGLGGERLGPLQLEAIAAAADESGFNVQYIDDPRTLIDELFNGARTGAAVLTIDALHLEPGRAEVELQLWCGSLCGVFLTYEVVETAAGVDRHRTDWADRDVLIRGPIRKVRVSSGSTTSPRSGSPR